MPRYVARRPITETGIGVGIQVAVTAIAVSFVRLISLGQHSPLLLRPIRSVATVLTGLVLTTSSTQSTQKEFVAVFTSFWSTPAVDLRSPL